MLKPTWCLLLLLELACPQDEETCSRHTSYHFMPLDPNQWPLYQFPLETYFLQSYQSCLKKTTRRKIESFLKHWFVICDYKYRQCNTDITVEPPPHDWVLLNDERLPSPHPSSTILALKYINFVVYILCIYCTYIVHILYIYCTYVVHIVCILNIVHGLGRRSIS